MPRNKRINAAGSIFHVLNRANLRNKIHDQQIDYQEFVKILRLSLIKFQIDIFAYTVMPNHWHIVCRPRKDGELSKWVAWLQILHTKKWHKRNNSIGAGHFYQGRFKSFLVQDDKYFSQVCMYVERNALRAGLVKRAEDWLWSSLSKNNPLTLEKWPIEKPRNYIEIINSEREDNFYLDKIRLSLKKDYPCGDKDWVDHIISLNSLWVNSEQRKRGRPKNKDKKNSS